MAKNPRPLGMPFEGMGLAGYDRYKEKYIETWVDNLGTMILVSEGSCDGTGRRRTVTANFTDPMTGVDTTFRSVYRIVDEDNYILELHSSLPDGSEFKIFEMPTPAPTERTRRRYA